VQKGCADRRSCEGNLPRLSRNDTEILFAKINNFLGTFSDERYKIISLSAMREFALPYCPWILKNEKESVPTNIECTSSAGEIVQPEKETSATKGLQKPVSDFVCASKTTLVK